MRNFLIILLFFVPVVSFAEQINLGTQGTDANQLGFGRSAEYERIAQPFTPSVSAADIAPAFYLVRAAAITDNIVMTIRDARDGTVLATQTYAGASVNNVGGSECNSAATLAKFATSTIALTGGVQYWVQLDRSGGQDAYPNVYFECGNNGASTAQVYNGTTWGTTSERFSGTIYLTAAAPAPSTSDGSATSTIEQAQQNLSTAFYLYFLGFLGMIWVLRRR